MSEFAPPAVPRDAVDGSPETLNSEEAEALLDEFRGWLRRHAADPLPEVLPAADEVDFTTLVSQFVALKQEVNLQTKATRAQQQQNAEALEQLGRAVESLEDRNPVLEQAAQQQLEERLRPVLKTFVDLWDALSLAQRETQRLQDALPPLMEPPALPDPPAALPVPPEADPLPSAPVGQRSFWGRLWFVGEPMEPEEALLKAQRQALEKTRKQLREQYALLYQQHAECLEQYEHVTALVARLEAARQNEERLRQMLASVVTGYTMSLQRLERALAQQELVPMECVGQPFDPETMEVVEVVKQPGRSGTEVIDEVRRGYLRRGKVFRYAQVRVAKP